MGSMNYAKYSERRKDFVFKLVFANPFDEIIELLEAMNELGIKPEHECFDVGHVGSLAPLIDMGVLEPPLHVDFVMGVDRRRARRRARNLAAMADNLPGGGRPLGRDRDLARAVDAGRRRADARRLGPRRASRTTSTSPTATMARSNGELIAKARQMTEDAGRRPATVEEARALLGVPAAAPGPSA